MAAAIFGLIGVVVGGIVTAGVELFVEWWRGRAELRVAKRLFAEELHTIWVQLALLAEEGRAPTAVSAEESERVLPTKTWEIHKTTLARKLSDTEWMALPTLMHNVETTRFVVQRTPGKTFDVAEARRLAEMRDMTMEFFTLLTGEAPEGVGLGQPST